MTAHRTGSRLPSGRSAPREGCERDRATRPTPARPGPASRISSRSREPMLRESVHVPLIPAVRGTPQPECPYAFLGPVAEVRGGRFDLREARREQQSAELASPVGSARRPAPSTTAAEARRSVAATVRRGREGSSPPYSIDDAPTAPGLQHSTDLGEPGERSRRASPSSRRACRRRWTRRGCRARWMVPSKNSTLSMPCSLAYVRASVNSASSTSTPVTCAATSARPTVIEPGPQPTSMIRS